MSIQWHCVHAVLSPQDQFVTPMKSKEEGVERTRAAMDERSSRIKDNKQTHLVLGFDQTPPLSEKVTSSSTAAD